MANYTIKTPRFSSVFSVKQFSFVDIDTKRQVTRFAATDRKTGIISAGSSERGAFDNLIDAVLDHNRKIAPSFDEAKSQLNQG